MKVNSPALILQRDVPHAYLGSTLKDLVARSVGTLQGARRRLTVTQLGASNLASAGMSVAGQVGSRAAMEVGPYISISSLDIAVGAGPALSSFGYEEPTF